MSNKRRIDIITATTIYDFDSVSHPTDQVKIYLKEFNTIIKNGEEKHDMRIQAWQYIKAYTQILKDRDEWDYLTQKPRL